MDKIYTIARTAAVLLAIVAAFVMVPQSAFALLLLGGIAALGHSTAEENVHTYLIAIVLTAGASALEAIPEVGGYLAAIFGNIATVAIGASIVAISVSLVNGLRAAWRT